MVLAGGAIVLSIPLAQLVVLRGQVDRAWRWVPVNVVAWLIGVTFTLAPGPFVDKTHRRRLLRCRSSSPASRWR